MAAQQMYMYALQLCATNGGLVGNYCTVFPSFCFVTSLLSPLFVDHSRSLVHLITLNTAWDPYMYCAVGFCTRAQKTPRYISLHESRAFCLVTWGISSMCILIAYNSFWICFSHFPDHIPAVSPWWQHSSTAGKRPHVPLFSDRPKDIVFNLKGILTKWVRRKFGKRIGQSRNDSDFVACDWLQLFVTWLLVII